MKDIAILIIGITLGYFSCLIIFKTKQPEPMKVVLERCAMIDGEVMKVQYDIHYLTKTHKDSVNMITAYIDCITDRETKSTLKNMEFKKVEKESHPSYLGDNKGHVNSQIKGNRPPLQMIPHNTKTLGTQELKRINPKDSN